MEFRSDGIAKAHLRNSRLAFTSGIKTFNGVNADLRALSSNQHGYVVNLGFPPGEALSADQIGASIRLNFKWAWRTSKTGKIGDPNAGQ